MNPSQSLNLLYDNSSGIERSNTSIVGGSLKTTESGGAIPSPAPFIYNNEIIPGSTVNLYSICSKSSLMRLKPTWAEFMWPPLTHYLGFAGISDESVFPAERTAYWSSAAVGGKQAYEQINSLSVNLSALRYCTNIYNDFNLCTLANDELSSANVEGCREMVLT